MTQGPWSKPPPQQPPPPKARRLWRSLALVAVCVAVVVLLARLVADRAPSGEDWAETALRGMMLVLVLSGLLARGLPLKTAARHGLGWLAIGGVLLLGFSFREELGFVAARMGSELAPSAALETRPGEMVVTREADGAFYVRGEVNGSRVRFLVDTGASDIVLSPADARRLGYDIDALDFAYRFQTANGEGRGAMVVADSVAVGAVRREGVRISVNQAPMSSSLLGMSFFRHLDSVEIRGDRLYLRWTG
jgi:aspartyl protease family protein